MFHENIISYWLPPLFSHLPSHIITRKNSKKENFRQMEKKILDSIIGAGRYDSRIRPSGVANGTEDGDGPALVRVNVYVRSISRIDDVTMVSMTDDSTSHHPVSPSLCDHAPFCCLSFLFMCNPHNFFIWFASSCLLCVFFGDPLLLLFYSTKIRVMLISIPDFPFHSLQPIHLSPHVLFWFDSHVCFCSSNDSLLMSHAFWMNWWWGVQEDDSHSIHSDSARSIHEMSLMNSLVDIIMLTILRKIEYFSWERLDNQDGFLYSCYFIAWDWYDDEGMRIFLGIEGG